MNRLYMGLWILHASRRCKVRGTEKNHVIFYNSDRMSIFAFGYITLLRWPEALLFPPVCCSACSCFLEMIMHDSNISD